MKMIKVLKSKWWDLFPAGVFLIVAVAEGAAFWLAGVGLIIWLFTLAIRHLK